MTAQDSSILTKTLQRIMPLWRESSLGRRAKDTLELSPDLNQKDEQELKHWIEACLASEGGEVAARSKAAALGRSFMSLNETGRMRFLKLLSENYGADENQINRMILRWQSSTGIERSACENDLRQALEPARMKLLTQFNELPEGVKFLVDMRADLLALNRSHPELTPLEHDLKRLLTSWFDIGLLQIEQITWHSSAEVLEKLISYEAVHEIKSWDDLKNRLDSDRRCFAFFHPSMPNEPLIFVEVALVNGLSDNVQHLLDINAPVLDIQQADTAIFYSISNAQKGLAGISFGNFLIKRVVKLLQAEFPQLKHFSTLSPIPGFCRWLHSQEQVLEEQSWLTPWLTQALNNLAFKQPLHSEKGSEDPQISTPDEQTEINPEQQEILINLAAYYLTSVRRTAKPGGLSGVNEVPSVKNPVAHFHLSNGAQVERLNWLADSSSNGLKQSAGLMVNYLYKLDSIEDNSRKYSEQGEVATSSEVKKRLKSPCLKFFETQ